MIASAKVANLQLAHTVAREHEVVSTSAFGWQGAAKPLTSNREPTATNPSAKPSPMPDVVPAITATSPRAP